LAGPSACDRWARWPAVVASAVVAACVLTWPSPLGAASAAQSPRAVAIRMVDFDFRPERLRASHGSIVLRLVNTGTIEHNVMIRGRLSRTVHVGQSDVMRVTLSRGRYRFYCAIAGHYGWGMKGVLDVR
jgi:plastocyanin